MDNVVLWILFAIGLLVIAIGYVLINDKRLKSLPPSIRSISKRLTPRDVRETASQLAVAPPISLKGQLPPKTGRRYIVVGGGGFLGSWIVVQLLERGEEPKNIRLLDLNPPVNYVVKEALGRGVQFIKTNVTDATAVEEAFAAPWNDGNDSPSAGTTVYHTAANIRFYERHPTFLPRSATVNVQGTQHVINACKSIGAEVLVYTSSGSVGVKNTRLLLWPWQKEPKNFVQVINDDDSRLPKTHGEFFSNYAVTKKIAEGHVRAADKTPLATSGKQLRTGCIRPGNGVFGPRGDMLCGAYLVRGSNPTWINNILQSFSYVENCALSHLLYERRLLDLIEQDKKPTGKLLPNIGGQAFCIADPGPTPTYGDVYTMLETLSGGECHFDSMSPTAMCLISYIIEFYYISRHYLLQFIQSLPGPLSRPYQLLSRLFPPIEGDIINLQPALFALTGVHLIFDDSRARLPPEQGGLGYKGAWTTVEGLYKTWDEFRSGIGKSDVRSAKAGVGFGFSKKKAKAASVTARVTEAVAEGSGIPVGPVEVLAVG